MSKMKRSDIVDRINKRIEFCKGQRREKLHSRPPRVTEYAYYDSMLRTLKTSRSHLKGHSLSRSFLVDWFAVLAASARTSQRNAGTDRALVEHHAGRATALESIVGYLTQDLK